MISVDKSTPEGNTLPSLEQLGPFLTTLPKSRAAASAPLAPIDYNVHILDTPTAAQGYEMALRPCLVCARARHGPGPCTHDACVIAALVC